MTISELITALQRYQRDNPDMNVEVTLTQGQKKQRFILGQLDTVFLDRTTQSFGEECCVRLRGRVRE